MVTKGKNGLGVQTANKLFEHYNVTFEDRKQEEGSYIAFHPDGLQTIRKGKVTELTQYVLVNWFTLK